MIQRATRKRLKIRNLTRNPDLSIRLSIFQVFRSCSNQNTRSAFLFYIFRIATDNKVKIGNWRSISDAKQFIFFTQFSARIQFSKYDLPILSFFVFRKVFRSCSNQNTRSTFLFYIFRIATENKVKIGNWRSISDARQFIFFTQFSARIQFSKRELPEFCSRSASAFL